MAELNDKNIKAALESNEILTWETVDDAASVCYQSLFVICGLAEDGGIQPVSLQPKSLVSFEWTNEANCLYLTGKLVVSDLENIMSQFYNTFAALHVEIKKYKYDLQSGTCQELLGEFEHDFLFDKMSIDKQQMRQSSSNDVLIYNITLKSLHAIKLFAHGSFSNWGSSEINFGNYKPEDDNDEDDEIGGSSIGSSLKNKLSKTGKKLAKNMAKDLMGKIKSIDLVEKLQEIAGLVNSFSEKLESFGISGNKTNQNPVKIYSIIKNILETSLNDDENKGKKFEFLNFDEVFGDQHPVIKYCMTNKETILDAVSYLQQKLFSLKTPYRINMVSDTGLSYISYDEFKNNFKVVYFKDIESFRAQDNESGFDLVQINGGMRLMEHVRKMKLKLLPPKQNKFKGMINYFTNFYHDSEYELLEDMHPGKTEFSKPSMSDEKIDYAEGVTKIYRESNEKLEFMQYADKFNELDKGSEQNIKSYGENIFNEPETEKAKPYTTTYSEDFDNNSYLELLEEALFRNTVAAEFTGNFFDVPGMVFKLQLESGAGGENDYYSQLNNAVMHITKVTHWFRKTPGMRDAEHTVGEELTLCKI